MIATFVDSSVLLLALGRDHPTRPACQHVVRLAETADLELHIAAETVQEVLFHRTRLGDRTLALQQVDDVRALCVVHPLDDVVLDRGLDLIRSTTLRGRDAFIAGTAMASGFDAIVTTDTGFDGVPGLRRVPPQDVR